MAYDNSGWVWINGLNVPVFSPSDFTWTPNPSYDPSSTGLGWRPDENGNMVQYDTGSLNQGSWGWSESGLARLKAGGWDPSNTMNVNFGVGTQGGEFMSGGADQVFSQMHDPNVNPSTQMGNAIYKNSDSTALQFTYDANGMPVAAPGGNWMTNNGAANTEAALAFGSVIGAGLAIPAIAGAAGAGAGAGAVGGAAPGEAAGAFMGSYPSAYAAPATGGMYGAGSPASYGYMDPSVASGGAFSPNAAYGAPSAATSMAPSASTGGTTGWPDVTGTNPTTGMPTTNDYMKYISAAGSAMPSSSGSSSGGSPLGAAIGAGLGYLDAAGQPTSLTTSTQLDPAMAQLIYGQNGLVSMGANAVNANGGQYIDAAGQQISQMGQTGPTPYNELVANNQALWSANPFLAEQQKAITEQMNTNFANNTLPAIGTGASMNGGYGGSRQGVAQGLASSGNSTATANALTGLAYNSWNDAQNRAMQGTQYQGQYGLAGTAQQAALLQQGANMQAGAPWYNVNQFGNMIHQIPTTGSQTTPLFNNTTAGALGGAQTGYNFDWGGLMSGIGGLFK